ncbi:MULTISPECIES: hypothetical protein [unclassified Lentimicrobium]|uniref:hypothetical protein n=1 Tax=unclassified Lentimicrobium TaxID=2677434 RepID=UPI0015548B3C|nr:MULTISPECIES: hypothetical protein [unclassified Lentimicrobium]NPD44964.1 hypothetical protein [Lentimicrobium sp. S6]NPD83470.1 hypothetical protein [Lentimicrobium sp. L6]
MEHKREDIEGHKKRLKEMVNSKDIISGIHNYCDRWCERCTHTKHCTVFLMEQEEKEKGDHDLNNKKFWNKLSLIFAATLEMVKEGAEELGIDLNEIEIEENPLQEKEKTITEKIAHDYGTKVYKWLDENRSLFEEKGKELLIIGEDKLIPLTEALEIINWYSIFIGAKTHRAFHNQDFDFDDPIQNDNNGSAKIALIAIDRSIEAFGVLLEQIPEKEDEILHFLILLSQIKNQLEAKFPKAWDFLRAGFDE